MLVRVILRLRPRRRSPSKEYSGSLREAASLAPTRVARMTRSATTWPCKRRTPTETFSRLGSWRIARVRQTPSITFRQLFVGATTGILRSAPTGGVVAAENVEGSARSATRAGGRVIRGRQGTTKGFALALTGLPSPCRICAVHDIQKCTISCTSSLCLRRASKVDHFSSDRVCSSRRGVGGRVGSGQMRAEQLTFLLFRRLRSEACGVSTGTRCTEKSCKLILP